MLELLKNHKPDLVKGKVYIYLIEFNDLQDPILHQIGLLRSETFGLIGAGTNKIVDIDDFDLIYTHIVITNDEEIIGSYRVTKMEKLMREGELFSHVSNNYFLNNSFYEKSKVMMELGRSFIQKKYWAGNYLDSLWYGIGLYFKRNPELKYMYGTISVGNSFSDKAKNYIKAYVDKWYVDYDGMATAKYEFNKIDEDYNFIMDKLNSNDPRKDLKVLNEVISELGFFVPPLLKKYLTITEKGGALIKSCGNEPSFNATSFLLVLEINSVKEIFKERYF